MLVAFYNLVPVNVTSDGSKKAILSNAKKVKSDKCAKLDLRLSKTLPMLLMKMCFACSIQFRPLLTGFFSLLVELYEESS